MTTNGAGGNGTTGNGSTGNGKASNDNGRKKKTEDEIPVAGQRVAVNAGTRFGVGMPVERSENFRHVVRRFLRRMRPERLRITAVLLLAVVSVTLTVIGPRILGHATNIIIAGIQTPNGIDFAELNMVLLEALLIYVSPASSRTRRASSSPASCSARCTSCAATSRTSSTASRSPTSTASRVAIC